MLPSNAIEAEASSLPSRYDKEFVADYSSRFAETEVAARYQEDEVKTSYRRSVYQEDSNKKTIVKTGSKFPNDRRSFSKGSSLQSLVRRRSRRHAQSSLPLDADLSAYSLYPEQKPEETCTCTSTLVYASRGENKDVSSSMNVAMTGTGNSVTCSFSGSRINTGSSTRTASVITAAGPSTSSSWNNSPEEELDYVVDPVQGNAYYKGQLLGKGGFAKVFLMTDVTNGNEYACKIIRKNRMQKIHMQKIAREIIIHKELNHVNVVQLHHYFEDNLNVYMLMEACPRKSLMHVLKYRGKVTEPEARYYMKQMVTGVAYIHSQRVVHRDLKPGNMFLSEQMIVKIGDFGLATRLDGQCRRVTICGTPNYIAPEVLYKQAYSYEADVWALGCILYALLVGQPPFDTATLKETYARICSNHYREVDGTMASRNGQDLIRWLLQPNPELRPSLEKVKEHPYLTEEYVPESLPRISCFQVPHTTLIENQGSSPSFDSSASANQKLNNVQVHTLQRTQQQDQHRGNISEKTLRKGSSKVISWLARKLRKVPKFRQRLSSVLCPDQKKTGYAVQSMQMHRALESCINGIKCKNKLRNHPPVKDLVPLFITKWIDYSNKYGLGFQLSDRSVGILFNDHTKISYTHDRKRVEYVTTEDEVTRFQKEEDVPTALQKKLLLLQRFTQYMDKFMTEGGEIKRHRVPTRNSRNSCVPRMRRWFRTDKTIVMELTVPLLQVNFFEDHTKLVLSQESPNKGYLVTYIDTSRRTSSYWLNDIRDLGCTADLYERLYHVYQVSREFAEVHDNTIG